MKPDFRACGHAIRYGEGLLACPDCRKVQQNRVGHPSCGAACTDAPDGWAYLKLQCCGVNAHVSVAEHQALGVRMQCAECFLKEHIPQCCCLSRVEFIPDPVFSYESLERAARRMKEKQLEQAAALFNFTDWRPPWMKTAEPVEPALDLSLPGNWRSGICACGSDTIFSMLEVREFSAVRRGRDGVPTYHYIKTPPCRDCFAKAHVCYCWSPEAQEALAKGESPNQAIERRNLVDFVYSFATNQHMTVKDVEAQQFLETMLNGPKYNGGKAPVFRTVAEELVAERGLDDAARILRSLDPSAGWHACTCWRCGCVHLSGRQCGNHCFACRREELR